MLAIRFSMSQNQSFEVCVSVHWIVFNFYYFSVGDADGKGNIRKQELFQACVALKVIYKMA